MQILVMSPFKSTGSGPLQKTMPYLVPLCIIPYIVLDVEHRVSFWCLCRTPGILPTIMDIIKFKAIESLNEYLLTIRPQLLLS